MTFLQLIDCNTDSPEALNKLIDDWVALTRGRRTATHAVIASDRADRRHFVEVVEFPSYEAAMRNSRLPETDRIFNEMVALCDEPPAFTDLDVVRDEQLNKTLVRNLFDALGAGDIALMDQLLTSDYVDHDQADETADLPLAGFQEKVRAYHASFGFAFAIDSQCADQDLVSTRWTWRATHTGRFMGLPATHRHLEVVGNTTFRIRDGRLCEGWWNWDNLGLLRQLGLVRL
jgi:steroid delta-isomerase-like uncharacterized protein